MWQLNAFIAGMCLGNSFAINDTRGIILASITLVLCLVAVLRGSGK